jgi:hypothetical protein
MNNNSTHPQGDLLCRKKIDTKEQQALPSVLLFFSPILFVCFVGRKMKLQYDKHFTVIFSPFYFLVVFKTFCC